jgi:hypothetical protein
LRGALPGFTLGRNENNFQSSAPAGGGSRRRVRRLGVFAGAGSGIPAATASPGRASTGFRIHADAAAAVDTDTITDAPSHGVGAELAGSAAPAAVFGSRRCAIIRCRASCAG